MSLVQDYFNETKKYKTKYGEKTVVLMQVGSFYEIYAEYVDNTYKYSNIQEVAKICDLQIVSKKQKNYYMAGFKDHQIEKYIQKILARDYTVVVIVQDEAACGTTRSVQGIYSPGTYFNVDDQEEITNYISCVWLHKFKQNIIIGMSAIDIFTGNSFLFEYKEPYSLLSSTYNELARFLSIYNSREMILIYNVPEEDLYKITQYIDIGNVKQHHINLIDADETENYELALKCEKQNYIKSTLDDTFYTDIYLLNEQFSTYDIATQSFCYLLHFINIHNSGLADKINEPCFEVKKNAVYLGNHSLKQLNIIADTSNKISSVSNFFNMAQTSIGKREITYLMSNPTYNEEYLQKEYDMIEYLYDKDYKIRDSLIEIIDIEKIYRKIVLHKISPQEIYNLYKNVELLDEIYKDIKADTTIINYINNDNIKKELLFVKKQIKERFNLDECKNNRILGDEINIIKKGVNKKLDHLIYEYNNSGLKYDAIVSKLDTLIGNYESKNKKILKKQYSYLTVNATEKSGKSISVTSRRKTLLQTAIEKGSHVKTIDIDYINSDNIKQTFTLDLSLIEYYKPTTQSSSYNIRHHYIDAINKILVDGLVDIKKEIIATYNQILTVFKGYHREINDIIEYVKKLDLITTKVHIAKKYNLSKPEIIESESSCLDIKQLRHPLIEHILEKELYVPNDIIFNENIQRGVCLYGFNAVGKSSFVKSIGISVVMAQAGFYVPCEKMVYKPYKKLFTRILSNDNLFKNQSTYMVEILELKIILDKKDKHSLILGDELCHGTEIDSAVGINIACLEELYDAKSSFIFATHLHELVRFKEITEKPFLSLKHISVVYDEESGTLLYERKLLDGNGSSLYGLEVAKYLKLDREFINKALHIRNKHNKLTMGDNLSVLEKPLNHYNKNKLNNSLCEYCKERKASETHHMQYQEMANDNNYITHFHKNHMANLINLCKECHDEIHKKNVILEYKKQNDSYILQEKQLQRNLKEQVNDILSSDIERSRILHNAIELNNDDPDIQTKYIDKLAEHESNVIGAMQMNEYLYEDEDNLTLVDKDYIVARDNFETLQEHMN